MPIFLSMIVWVVLMRILCSGSMRYTRLPGGSRAYKVPTMVSVLTMGYIVFWIGMRTGIADTAMYVKDFNQTSTDLAQLHNIMESGGKGALWQIGIVLFKAFISENWQIWLLCLSIIMGFSVSHCHQHHSEAFFFSMLLFLLATDFTWMLNGMRQFICVSTLMVALPWLIEGKTKHYMILIAALSLIHFTVWIMVPIYFVVRQRPWSKLVILAILATCGICALAAPFTEAVESALQNTEYKGVEIANASDDGAHPIRVLILAVPAIMAWLNRNTIRKENNLKLNIFINLSLMSALLMLFAAFTSGIMMGRLAIYCSVYSAITLPMLISRWPNKSLHSLIRLACIAGYAAYFYIETRGLYYNSILTGYIY